MVQAAEIPVELEADLDDDQRRIVRRCLLALAVMGTGSMIGATSGVGDLE